MAFISAVGTAVPIIVIAKIRPSECLSASGGELLDPSSTSVVITQLSPMISSKEAAHDEHASKEFCIVYAENRNTISKDV